jgi:site-specific recombinase XerD
MKKGELKYNERRVDVFMEDERLIVFNSKNKLRKSVLAVPPSTHFIRHYLNGKSKKSYATARDYETDIKQFFKVKWVENITLDHIKAVTIFDVEDFIVELIDKELASGTIHRKVSTLSSLYQWLMKYQDNTRDITIIKYNPFSNMKDVMPTLNYVETEFLTEEEAEKILNAINDKTIIGLRNKIIVALALTTAVRKREFINIRLKDITTKGGYDIINVIRKRDKHDFVKLQAPVRNLILDYISLTGRDMENYADDYLFKGHSRNKMSKDKLDASTPNKIVKSLCKKVGITKNIKVHSLRHSAITWVIMKGATLEKAKEFAAHESATTTARYIHSVDKLRNNAGDLINIL